MTAATTRTTALKRATGGSRLIPTATNTITASGAPGPFLAADIKRLEALLARAEEGAATEQQ
jgi:hypothetical protein